MMRKKVTQGISKGAVMCLMVSACLLFIGAFQTADSRVHRKPDIEKYKHKSAYLYNPQKDEKVASVKKENADLPWLSEVKYEPKQEQHIVLPWQNKKNFAKKLSVQKAKPSEKKVTYIAPQKKEVIADIPVEAPTQTAEAKKTISIRDVVAQRVKDINDSPDHGNDVFGDEVEVVSNKELGDVRGGFITAGGLMFDIGLFTQTILDGVVIDEINLDANELINQNAATQLNRTISVDANGATTITNLDLPDASQLITAIQNSASNVSISNVTTLNVEVQNGAAFVQQSQLPLFNHQIVQGLQ